MLATPEITKADVLEFLTQKGCTIELDRIQRGCRVRFPERVLGESPRLVEYKMTTQKGQNIVRIMRDGEKFTCEVPIYASRIFIFFDIVEQCMQIGYNPDYLRFFDNSVLLGTLDEITFNEFLREGFGPDVKKKEEALWGIFTHSFNTGFPEEDFALAENLGVEEGYVVLYECFNLGD